MKFQFFVFSSSTEELPFYMRESNIQGCLEFPSLVDLTIYLFNLNEEVSLSLGIMVYDSQRQMLTSVILIMYFIQGIYKELNIFIILMMKERKEKLHSLLFII